MREKQKRKPRRSRYSTLSGVQCVYIHTWLSLIGDGNESGEITFTPPTLM